jgi:hypothetical protein
MPVISWYHAWAMLIVRLHPNGPQHKKKQNNNNTCTLVLLFATVPGTDGYAIAAVSTNTSYGSKKQVPKA